jgi:hypothetical protein
MQQLTNKIYNNYFLCFSHVVKRLSEEGFKSKNKTLDTVFNP